MIKKMLFSLLLVVTTFSLLGIANVAHYRLKFKVNAPFVLEPNARVGLPAGEYLIKDCGTAPGHLLSLQRAKDMKHLAWLNTAPVDRKLFNWKDLPIVSFNYENSQLPMLNAFYPPGKDGYEILSINYDTDAGFIDVASLTQSNYKITEKKIKAAAVEQQSVQKE